MVKKKKISKSTSVKSKTTSASPGKRKLGEASLDWITDTTEGEDILSEQAESSKNMSAGKLIEKKIGILKQYVFARAKKKKDETPEIPPVISGSSSTIIKGTRITPAKEEEAQKTETIEIGEEKKTAETELPSVPDDSAEIPGEKKDKIPPEYEVKKEEVISEEKIVSEKPSALIPEDSSSIVKKKTETASQEEIISGEDKTSSEKKKTDVTAAEEEMPSSTKRKWMKISGLGGALKKGCIKVSGAVVKPFKSDKTIVRKSVSAVVNVSKQPAKAISAVDRKITQSMKKVVTFGEPGVAGKSILLKNIKSTDTQITKSAKQLIDSILN